MVSSIPDKQIWINKTISKGLYLAITKLFCGFRFYLVNFFLSSVHSQFKKEILFCYLKELIIKYVLTLSVGKSGQIEKKKSTKLYFFARIVSIKRNQSLLKSIRISPYWIIGIMASPRHPSCSSALIRNKEIWLQ